MDEADAPGSDVGVEDKLFRDRHGNAARDETDRCLSLGDDLPSESTDHSSTRISRVGIPRTEPNTIQYPGNEPATADKNWDPKDSGKGSSGNEDTSLNGANSYHTKKKTKGSLGSSAHRATPRNNSKAFRSSLFKSISSGNLVSRSFINLTSLSEPKKNDDRETGHDSEDEDGCDMQRLSRALRGAVKHSDGVSAAEVWVFSQDEQKLIQPEGGWWRDPKFSSPLPDSLDRLENKSRKDYMAAQPLLPGVGLAGGLWAEVHNSGSSTTTPKDPLQGSHHRNVLQGSLHRRNVLQGSIHRRRGTSDTAHNHQTRQALIWRDLQSLLIDPDHPTFPRLLLLKDAGFDIAAGVPFDAPNGEKGIVVYLSDSAVPMNRLTAHANDTYLRVAAHMVGAATALTQPRMASVRSREEALEKEEAKKAKNNLELKDAQDGEWDEESHSCITSGLGWAKAWRKKWAGGGLQPPPRMSSSQSFLTFFGAFTTMIILGWVSEQVKIASNGQHTMALGPFGALMMLQYGLAMAPASQPRSALLGHFISFLIAYFFSFMPETSVPVWVRVALATSTSVSAMARFGVIHPPAAANVTILSSGPFDWMSLLLLMVGNVIAIATATAINNLSNKRQYPTFWNLGMSSATNFIKNITLPRMEEKGNTFKPSNRVSESDSASESKHDTDLCV